MQLSSCLFVSSLHCRLCAGVAENKTDATPAPSLEAIILPLWSLPYAINMASPAARMAASLPVQCTVYSARVNLFKSGWKYAKFDRT